MVWNFHGKSRSVELSREKPIITLGLVNAEYHVALSILISAAPWLIFKLRTVFPSVDSASGNNAYVLSFIS